MKAHFVIKSHDLDEIYTFPALAQAITTSVQLLPLFSSISLLDMFPVNDNRFK